MEGCATIELDALTGFRHEAGIHRIQRIPPTERRGRVHTSTVTVSVLDSAAPTSMTIDPADLRIRWFSGTGKGGQHRNKHQTSVELIHAPSGLSRSAQTRSRETSMREALSSLQEAVSKASRLETAGGINASRTAQIGAGTRADQRRRIYRFREDRVSDLVTGREASCSRFMRGSIDLLWPQKGP